MYISNSVATYAGITVIFVLLLVSSLVAAAQSTDYVYSEQNVFRLDDRFRLTREVKLEYQIQSDRATRQNQHVVYEPFYAPVENLSAKIGSDRFGNDHIREVMAEARDIFLSGGRLHVLDYPRQAEVGDRIQIEYRQSYSELAYTPLMYVPNVDFLGDFEIVLEHPDHVQVVFHVYFPRDEVAFQEVHEEGRSAIQFSDLSSVDELPYFAFNDIHAVVQIEFQIAERSTAINPVSAEDFADWYRAKANSVLYGSTVPQELLMSLSGESPEETISHIHDHVRENIRYVADERGENAFVPRAPDVVLQRGYGDCKDRAFLVQALAQELGHTVDIVLVSTDPVAEFSGTHVGLYNHVINAYETEDGQLVYFDPTHRYVPYGTLPESDAEIQGLHISEDGAQLIRIPRAQEAQPMLEVSIRTTLDSPEESIAQVTVRAPALSYVREQIDRGLGLDVENALIAVTSSYLQSIRLENFVQVADNGTELTYLTQANLSDFLVASPTRRYIPKTPFSIVSSNLLERSQDSYDIYTDSAPYLRLSLEIGDTNWSSEPDALMFGDDEGPGSFRASLTPNDDSTGTQIVYEFRQRSKRLEEQEKESYLNFARQYLDNRSDMFIFRGDTTMSGSTDE